MRIVLDTNVLVSGLLSPHGPPASILSLVVNSNIQLLYDNRLLQEYIEVLHRDKFSFSTESIDALISYILAEGAYVSAEPVGVAFSDDDDRMFYEVMITGEANYLVTGNRTHFPKDLRVKSPREFLGEYDKKENGE